VAVGLATGVALATLLPVWIAHQMAPPGHTFAGFLLNPVDGFSYLAKMRQGFDGSWLFHLPYASGPSSGAFLFPYYLLLGHIARLIGADLVLVLHAARAAAAALMFIAIYRFLEEFVAERGERWFAFAVCLVGAGWGWMVIPFGFVASDLSIPESTPFLSAYANAHFPIAWAAFMGAAVGVLGGQAGRPRWMLAALLCGAGMALVLPFVLLPAVVAMLTGLLVLAISERRDGLASSVRPRLFTLSAFLIGAAPWAAYDLWLLRTRPDLAAWNAQNQTPSPTPVAYLLGFAPLLVLAGVAIFANRRLRGTPALLLGWAITQAILLYAPLALQRRLSLGLFVPLAALAAIGLSAAARRGTWRRPLATLVLASAIPSNLIVIAAGLGGVLRAEPALVQSEDEVCALQWLAENAAPGSLVLAGETAGNRLPAFADVRVIYGHPFETPGASAELALVESLFSGTTDLDAALSELTARGVDFVYFGPEEQALGPAPWPAQLPAAAICGRVIVAGVPAP
jgi:hypothetical protein